MTDEPDPAPAATPSTQGAPRAHSGGTYAEGDYSPAAQRSAARIDQHYGELSQTERLPADFAEEVVGVSTEAKRVALPFSEANREQAAGAQRDGLDQSRSHVRPEDEA